jgi:type IV secretory pathway VirJ component
MKKIFFSLLLTGFIGTGAFASPADMPLQEWKATNSLKPFVFYISGDGGFNNFSTGLCGAFNKSGYDVASLSARSYFWNKKTPEETATDICNFLTGKFKARTNQQLVLVGYSFGADVMPFIINHLSDDIKKKLTTTVMLSPSTSTDFEIHIFDLLGGNKKRNMDVVAEINKLQVPKLVTIFGSDEDDFPVGNIHLKNHTNLVLAGGHHYDKNTEQAGAAIIKQL